MTVLHIQNPQALTNPNLVNLFKEALSNLKGAMPGGFDSCAVDIFNMIKDPEWFVVAGVEDGDFTTLGVGSFPGQNIFPYPLIFLFYNRRHASKDIREGVKAKMLDIMTQRGYTIFRTANTSGRPDRAWEKITVQQGTKLHRVGSLYEIRVE